MTLNKLPSSAGAHRLSASPRAYFTFAGRPEARTSATLNKLANLAGIRAMPSARAATPSGPSLLHVSGLAGIAIATVSALYFAGQLVRGVL